MLKKRKKVEGFTLQEVLIVLVIIGILVLLAIPNLMPLITKAKSTEAQLQLKHLYTLERTYFMMHSKYSDAFSELGFEPESSVEEGGNANYTIEVVDAATNRFLARATAVVDFDGDGNFNTWEIDHSGELREVQPD